MRYIRFACWVTKATETHSEYIILIVFPHQQRLRERTSMLRYTYMAFLADECISLCNDVSPGTHNRSIMWMFCSLPVLGSHVLSSKSSGSLDWALAAGIHSQYSDLLQNGRFGVRTPMGGGEICRTSPDPIRGPPSTIQHGYLVLSPGLNGQGVELTTYSNLAPRLLERIELYLSLRLECLRCVLGLDFASLYYCI